MNTSNLQDWARGFFKRVDAQNARALERDFADDIHFRMGNLEPLLGRDAVIGAFLQTDENFSGITHDIMGAWTGTWDKGEVVSVEALATYNRSGRTPVTIPVTSTLRLNADRQVADYRIFIDPAPVFD
ncbi:MAG: nuclear transport factor 2 family protein [Pseudomonadota bacterium]